jgi:hypothetical protein
MKSLSCQVAAAVLLTSVCSQSAVADSNYDTTGTGLDKITEIINSDKRLSSRVSPEGIAVASDSANRMNEIILEAIYSKGAANDQRINTADVRSINDYIHDNYYEEWLTLHGDDEDGVESGFHFVQNNGARTILYGVNAINQLADGIYHLGFEPTRKFRLTNEDGNRNKTFMKIAHWLDTLLRIELQSGTLANASIQEPEGTTFSGLDQVITAIYNDQSLETRISLDDMREGAQAADAMNQLIMKAVHEQDLNSDGEISVDDTKAINRYLVTNYAVQWAALHGDDEKQGEESGYHLVQSDGARTYMFGANALNRVFDGIYHLGFEADGKGKRLLNEDGNKNTSFRMVAYWLDSLING